MKRRDFLERWGLSSLKINLGFLEGEFAPSDPDRAAAWELYIELLTRITTQYLSPEDGDEKTALDSVFDLSIDSRDLKAARLRERRVRQARNPGTQPDNPPLYRQVASSLARRRVPRRHSLS
jgi:hypothetical protein